MPKIPGLEDIPDSLSAAAFWDLVGSLEHELLDFKRGAPDLTAIVPAMAMTDGGVIALGITDQRRITGCPLSQNTFDRVTQSAHACGVEVQLKEVQIDGTPVTLVAVPEVRGRIVTTPDGRLVRRVGSQNQPLVGDALARFVREREERPAEEESLPIFEPEEFDIRLVNRALQQDGRPAAKRDSLLRGLIDLRIASPAEPPTGPKIMKAAAVLFASDPSKYVPGASVQLVRRRGVGPGPGPSVGRREVRGPMELVLADAIDFIGKHTAQYQVVLGTHREILPEYPAAVLREAILNALAHRDYGLVGTTVDITIWDDRIEIQSPGPLPGNVTVENIREEHYSRNRRIMQILRLLGLVEEYGEGVDRMFSEMEARLMEPPLFTATDSSVTVTLRNRFLVSVEDQAWLSLLGQYNLSASERRLLVAARREDGITPRRARQLILGGNVESLIASAVAKGLLVRTGRAGGARYVLSDEVVMRAGATGLEGRNRMRQILLDEIRRRGSLSTTEGASLLNEDASVVRHLLNDLARTGLAVPKGKTRARRYYPT